MGIRGEQGPSRRDEAVAPQDELFLNPATHPEEWLLEHVSKVLAQMREKRTLIQLSYQ
jgi:hypothetical protein